MTQFVLEQWMSVPDAPCSSCWFWCLCGHHRSRETIAGSKGFPGPAQSGSPGSAIAIYTPASFPKEMSSTVLSPNSSQVMVWMQHCYEKEGIQHGDDWGNSPRSPFQWMWICFIVGFFLPVFVTRSTTDGREVLHGFFGVKDPLELDPSGLRSCPASISNVRMPTGQL